MNIAFVHFHCFLFFKLLVKYYNRGMIINQAHRLKKYKTKQLIDQSIDMKGIKLNEIKYNNNTR